MTEFPEGEKINLSSMLQDQGTPESAETSPREQLVNRKDFSTLLEIIDTNNKLLQAQLSQTNQKNQELEDNLRKLISTLNTSPGISSFSSSPPVLQEVHRPIEVSHTSTQIPTQ